MPYPTGEQFDLLGLVWVSRNMVSSTVHLDLLLLASHLLWRGSHCLLGGVCHHSLRTHTEGNVSAPNFNEEVRCWHFLLKSAVCDCVILLLPAVNIHLYYCMSVLNRPLLLFLFFFLTQTDSLKIKGKCRTDCKTLWNPTWYLRLSIINITLIFVN